PRADNFLRDVVYSRQTGAARDSELDGNEHGKSRDKTRAAGGCRQDRACRVRETAGAAWSRDTFDRGHDGGSGSGRRQSAIGGEFYRLAGDAGRAGEDAASKNPWRNPGAAWR